MKNRGILHQLPEEARYIVFSEMPISVLGTTESAIERRGLGFFHSIKQSSCEGNYLAPAVSKLRMSGAISHIPMWLQGMRGDNYKITDYVCQVRTVKMMQVTRFLKTAPHFIRMIWKWCGKKGNEENHDEFESAWSVSRPRVELGTRLLYNRSTTARAVYLVIMPWEETCIVIQIAACPYPELAQSSPWPHPTSWIFILILSSHLRLSSK